MTKDINSERSVSLGFHWNDTHKLLCCELAKSSKLFPRKEHNTREIRESLRIKGSVVFLPSSIL